MGEPALKVQARDFDPTPFITRISKKDYLTVAGRILWFRHYHPTGVITTSLLSMEPLVVQATVSADGGQVLATGLGSANAGGRQVVWSGREIEKAETAAIGRALAHAGFGTQFVDEDEEHLADSPVELKTQSAKTQQNGAPKMEWPSIPALEFLEKYIADKLVSMSRSEIARLSGVAKFDDLDGWKKYADGKAAFNAIEATFNAEMANTPPAQPQAAQSNTAFDEGEAGTVEPPEDTGEIIPAMVLSVTVKTGKNDKPYYSLRADIDGVGERTVNVFSREKFVEAGWITDDDWELETDEKLKLDPVIPVQVVQNGKFWNLYSVDTPEDFSDMKNLPESEVPF